MEESEEQPKPRRRLSKSLPPLTTEGEAPAAPTGEKKKRRKKKAAAPQAAAVKGEEQKPETPAAENKPEAKPKRKKKVPKEAPETSGEVPSPAHDPTAGRSTEQLIEDAPKKTKRKKKKEEARPSPEGAEEASPVARTIDVRGMPLAQALSTVKSAGQATKPQEDEDDDEDMLEEEVVMGGQSIHADKIFCQTQDTRYFKEETREEFSERVRRERLERENYLTGEEAVDTSNRTLSFAVGFTKGFNYLGTLIIGMISGMSVMHTVYVWGLSTNYLTFLADYTSYSQPMSLIYYIGLTVVMLSVLERYDYGRLQAKACLECLSFKHAGMVLVILLPCYVISNITTPTALWMHRFAANATIYNNQPTGDSTVATWKILDAVRSGCLVVTWMVVAFNPEFNKLSTNLQSELDDAEEEYQLKSTPTHKKTVA